LAATIDLTASTNMSFGTGGMLRRCAPASMRAAFWSGLQQAQ
jgi:hypothetical protein